MVSIPQLKYHETFFRILADYHLHHLVNYVAIHIYARDIFRILTDYRLGHLVNNVAIHMYIHYYNRMEITVFYLKITPRTKLLLDQ
jgi:hypothetical protein